MNNYDDPFAKDNLIGYFKINLYLFKNNVYYNNTCLKLNNWHLYCHFTKVNYIFFHFVFSKMFLRRSSTPCNNK